VTLAAEDRFRAWRPVTSACLLLLFLVLPALVAGVRIDAPARPGEMRRVEEALDPGVRSASSPVARMYYGMTTPSELDDQAQVLVLARRAQLLGILGLTCLLYLSVSLVRGRTIAVLACLALAALPPISVEGYMLRPETPVALFGSLAVLLLQGLPRSPRSGHRAGPLAVLSQLALMSAVGVALGLAVSALNTYTVYLLLPSAMLLLAVLLLVLRFSRLVRRRGFDGFPARSFAMRLLPWVGTAFLTLVFGWMLSSVLAPSAVPQPGTITQTGLLPEPAVVRLALLVVAGIGGAALVLRTGVAVGRTGRLSPDSVLLVYVAIMLVARWLHGSGADSLPAAPALAVLVAEGIGVLAVLWATRFWGSRGPTGRPWPGSG
jgi:hypothetical protein